MNRQKAFRVVLGFSILGLLMAMIPAVSGMLGSNKEPVAAEEDSQHPGSFTEPTLSPETAPEPVETSPKPRSREAGAGVSSSSSSSTLPSTTTTEKAKPTSTAAPKKTTTSAAQNSETTSPQADVPDDAIRVAPGQSIQAAVDSHPAKTTFVIGAGVHKRQEVKPKDGNRFVGEEGAILDGEKAARHAFSGYVSSVVIEGLVIHNYANSTETGAVTGGSGWVVKGNEIANNRGGGVFASDGWTVAGNNIHHNGQIGILANGRGITISGNTIAYNNTDGHDSHWEAGGTKFFGQATRDLVVKKNKVHNNDGPGLWTDYVGSNTLYEGNVVKNNAGPGIFHEISGSAVIHGNTVEGNGDGKDYMTWVDGAGILVNSSRDTNITGNVVWNNNDGIGLVESGRANGLRNITVKDNKVSLRDASLTGAVAVSDSAAKTMGSWNLVFDGNKYSGGGSKNFAWGGSYISWSAWRDAGHDKSGSFN